MHMITQAPSQILSGRVEHACFQQWALNHQNNPVHSEPSSTQQLEDWAGVRCKSSSSEMADTFAGLCHEACFPALQQLKCILIEDTIVADSLALRELDLQHWRDVGPYVYGVQVTVGYLPRLEVLRLDLYLPSVQVNSPSMTLKTVNLLAVCICFDSLPS